MRLPVTRSGMATFSQVVMWSSRRKSWKTMPMRRRSCARLAGVTRLMSWPSTWIWPRVGWIDMNSRRSSEVLPEPDGPGEEVEGAGPQMKGHVAQHLVPAPYFKPMPFSLITLSRGLRTE